MIDSIANRHELITLIGTPLRVEATFVSTGTMPGRTDRSELLTALLEDIRLEGVEAPIDHAWVRLGPTASARAKRFGRKLRRVPVTMTAEVVPYRAGEYGREIRLGLGEISDVVVVIGGKPKTLARNREAVDTERGERYTRAGIENMLDELMRREQFPTLERLRELAGQRKLDKSCQDILTRFFVRDEPVTDGQMRHALRVLESA